METIGRPERREFRMDPALLWSVIESQAGSAEKALLEAIMNAVDAGATRCDITLSETGYSVQDDGGGFKSRDDIEQFFETFGTPHKDGDGAVAAFCILQNPMGDRQFHHGGGHQRLRPGIHPAHGGAP